MTQENQDNLEHTKEEKELALGGNIALSGFKSIGRSEMVVVKKIVGSYARKMSDTLNDFEELKITLKIVHKTEASEKFELKAHLHVNGKVFTADCTERNLFIGLDELLKKAMTLATR